MWAYIVYCWRLHFVERRLRLDAGIPDVNIGCDRADCFVERVAKIDG